MYIYENKISVPLDQGEEQSVMQRSSQRFYYPNQVQGLEGPMPQPHPPSSRRSTDMATWTAWLDQNASGGQVDLASLPTVRGTPALGATRVHGRAVPEPRRVEGAGREARSRSEVRERARPADRTQNMTPSVPPS